MVGQFAFCAALYATNIYRLTPDRIDVSIGVRIAILVALCGCSYLRRRAPVTALALALVPFGVDLWLGATLPVWLILSDLVYALALYGTDRQSVGIVRLCACLSLVTCGVVFAATHNGDVVVIAVGAAAAFLGTPLWWARSVRQHKATADAERARAEALTVIAELDRRAAIEAERSRMARDLHDVVAGHISAIAIQSEAVLRLVGRPTPDDSRRPAPDIRDIVTSIRTNSTDALSEMRSMIGLLRGNDSLDDLVTAGRLDELPRLFDSARASGTEVQLLGAVGASPRTGEIPAAVDQAAYRIVQESLTNAIVHAPGQRTVVELQCVGETLTIIVANDVGRHRPERNTESHRASNFGTELGTTERRGTGLNNMRQRAELLGGHVHAGRDGSRWTVKAVIPLTSSAAP